jgi:trigger factor
VASLRVDVRDSGVWEKTLTIEVPAEELDADFEAVFEDYRRRASIPGFRKGKAPRTVLEQQFGHSLEHDVLERAVKRSYESALREVQLQPISYPAIEKISFDRGKPLTYEAKVEIRPEVTPKNYEGLELPTRDTDVPDEAIEKALEDLRGRSATWEDVDRPATDADALVVDYARLNAKGKPVRKSEQKDAQIELGATGLLPEFKTHLVGKKAGDHVRFDVLYPDEFGNEELRGRSVTFAVDVKAVREKKERALDDQLAVEVAGMRDLAELRSRIRLNMEAEARLHLQREQDDALVDQLVDRNPFELPESMVAEYLDELLQRLNREGRELSEDEASKFRAEYRPMAERRLKRDLLLDALAKVENVQVGEDEVDQALRAAAEGELNAAETERLLRHEGQRERVRAHIAERKAMALLRERAKPKTLIVTP